MKCNEYIKEAKEIRI